MNLSDGEDILMVPCGKCLCCLVKKRNDWSYRLFHEHRSSRGAAFITLTYSPKFVPDDGVSKRHVQLFFKRLRKRIGKKIRYYCVAEYGSLTQRPHYHILLFNYELSDEVFIRKAWSTKEGEPFGLVHFGKVTEASIRYCTKYVIQRPQASPKLSRPFALMSRSYGIGGAYLTDAMIAWHRGSTELGSRSLSVEKAKVYAMFYDQKVALPRYYKDKIWPLPKYKNPLGADPYWQYIRKMISEKSAQLVRESEAENIRLIRDSGYDNPEQIIREMRNAQLSRVQEKVAFTQFL